MAMFMETPKKREWSKRERMKNTHECQNTTIEAGRTKYTIYVNSLKISELYTALEWKRRKTHCIHYDKNVEQAKQKKNRMHKV